jgi:purine catabolism regulator
MKPTISWLVGQRDLGLHIVVRGSEFDDPIGWVASSDLMDPTPFLGADQLLLTTGRQFADFAADDYAMYVRRLLAAGVSGIGFGTEVLRDGTPDDLVTACRDSALTLIEVPYRTPFLALIRSVAAEVERDARQRDEWALSALRAIPVAALTGDVAASLAELAQQLEGSVVLVDRGGEPAEPVGSGRLSPVTLAAITEEARRVLRAGRRGGSDLPVDEGAATFQTLGRGGRLWGVLVVLTAARLDRAARLVLNAVVALLEVAAEHQDEAVALRQRASDLAVAAALDGRDEVAHALMSVTGEELPDEPLVVTVSAFGTANERDLARASVPTSGVLAGVHDHHLVTIASGRAWRRRVERMTAAGGRTGTVTGGTWIEIARAVERARSALHRTTAAAPVVEWDGDERGVLEAIIASRETAIAARTALAGVRADPNGSELLDCARVWLAHDARWDAAAKALGMHRHSLRDRIRRLGALLDLDVETFDGKAELHVLLRASGQRLTHAQVDPRGGSPSAPLGNRRGA